tara:strand:- start:6246 stop:6476 length:231 start_codon:yes stop_codon:yes gene_type:complete
MLTMTGLLSEINTLFIEITRDRIFKTGYPDDFLAHVKKCLKLKSAQDWNYIFAPGDIVEDTSETISNFLRFGTSGR